MTHTGRSVVTMHRIAPCEHTFDAVHNSNRRIVKIRMTKDRDRITRTRSTLQTNRETHSQSESGKLSRDVDQHVSEEKDAAETERLTAHYLSHEPLWNVPHANYARRDKRNAALLSITLAFPEKNMTSEYMDPQRI